jgi:hypothetical protein
VDDILVVLEGECAGGSDREPTRRGVYLYGMPTFLATLHCPCARERMATFLTKLTAPIALPRRYLAGITRHLLAVSGANAVAVDDDGAGSPERVDGDGGDADTGAERRELTTETDALLRGGVERRFWGRDFDEIEPIVVAPAGDTSAPSPVRKHTARPPQRTT